MRLLREDHVHAYVLYSMTSCCRQAKCTFFEAELDAGCEMQCTGSQGISNKLDLRCTGFISMDEEPYGPIPCIAIDEGPCNHTWLFSLKTEGQTDRQAGRQTETGRQTDKQADSKPVRQRAGRGTDRDR